MTSDELEKFMDEADDKQNVYREKRRGWAFSIGNPYLEDGGDKGNRSGDAAPRTAKNKVETNF